MKKHLAIFLVLMSVALLFAACGPQNPSVISYNLSVIVEGEGIVGPMSGSYPTGTNITFQVMPSTGWSFDRWEGQNQHEMVGSGNNWRILMNSDKFLKAVFTKNSGGGTYRQLSVQVQGQGSITPSSGSFLDGQVVNFTIQPQYGWSFKEWAGEHGSDVMRSGNEWAIRMNSDKRLIAIFTEDQGAQYRLDITVIGKGTVEQRIANDDNTDYPEGTRVRLWAKPNDNWLFKEWRGDAYGNEPITYVNMNGDRRVTAVFEEKTYDLTVTIVGQGKVEERLLGEYPYNSIVELTAKPSRGWSFKEWRGDASGKNPKYNIEITGDMKVTAVFEVNEVNLDIKIIGKGKVEEKLISDIYEPGSIVELKAVPAKNWEFKKWQGDATGSKPVIQIEVDEDMEITAVFEEKDEYTINVTITGKGDVEQTLIKGITTTSYPFGSIVKLTATANSGWRFKEWRGDAQGKNKEIEIEVDEDKEVEAIFEEFQGGTGQVSGNITMTHLWPSPHATDTYTAAKPGKYITKLPVFDHLVNRLSAQPKEQYVPGEYIVGFYEDSMLLADDEVQILEDAGFTVKNKYSLSAIHAYVVNGPIALDKVSSDLAVAGIKDTLNNKLAAQNSRIRYVEPNYKSYVLSNTTNYKVPNDQLLSYQWHYPQVRIPQAWSVTTGSKSVRIAVLDTGVNTGHPDLKANIDVASGWNFVDNSSNTTDRHSHGSHCAGTIGADTNNTTGVAGINWDATILPIKVMGDGGSGSNDGIAAGILYVSGVGQKPISSPVHVISMSLGGPNPSTVLEDACNKAVEAGVVVIAAAGNDNGPVGYPAAIESVICISATNYNYPNAPQRARYSSYGPQVDVAAPGGDVAADSDGDGYADGVLSTAFPSGNPNEFGYHFFNGTSMACPHAAGIAGLMIANGVPAAEIREVMRRTSMDLGAAGFDNEFGYGLLNTYWAVCNVKSIKIVVGNRNGNSIDIVAEGSVDLQSKTYTLGEIPSGDYKVYGWIDVQNTGTIDPGDYLFESQTISFRDNDKQTVNLSLKEVK